MIRRILRLDQFLRVHFFGFTSLLVLLGAASVEPAPNASTLVVLVGLAAAFHIFAYLQNDVLDLAIDRTQPLRKDDLLVTGTVRPSIAMAFALAQLPISMAAAWWAGAPALTFLVILSGFSLMTIYNVYGKRCPVPPVTDFVQGVAWGSLAIVGALVAGKRVDVLTLLPAGFGAGFLFLINGVHGGLRDLANDLRCGMRTTAIFFGASPLEDGVRSTRKLRIFAFAAFGTLVVPPALALVENLPGYGTQTWWLVTAAWLGVQAISTLTLWYVVRSVQPDRGWIISAHGLPLLLPPILLFAPLMSVRLLATCVICFLGPFLGMDPSLESLRAAWGEWRHGEDRTRRRGETTAFSPGLATTVLVNPAGSRDDRDAAREWE